jgi:hypothetical protein
MAYVLSQSTYWLLNGGHNEGNPILINPWEKKIYATKEGVAYQTILSRGWLRLCAKESVSTLDL